MLHLIINQKAEADHIGIYVSSTQWYMYLPSVVVISLILGLDSSSCQQLLLTEGGNAFSCSVAFKSLISNQKAEAYYRVVYMYLGP